MSALGQIVAQAQRARRQPVSRRRAIVPRNPFLRGALLYAALIESGTLTTADVRAIVGVKKSTGKRYVRLLATLPGVSSESAPAPHGGLRRVLRYTPPDENC